MRQILTQPGVVIPLLARRYVAWTERNLVQQCIELRVPDLRSWTGPVTAPPGIEIVPLPECDSESLLCRLFNECSWDSPGYRPARLIHMLALRAAPHHDPAGILVARAGEQFVGLCIGRPRSGGRGLINGLAVHPEHRGSGIGRALLRRGLLYLQSKGACEAMVRVHPDNVLAQRLYFSEGFQHL